MKVGIVEISSLELGELPSDNYGFNIMGIPGNHFPIASAAARLKLSKELSENSGNIWTIWW